MGNVFRARMMSLLKVDVTMMIKLVMTTMIVELVMTTMIVETNKFSSTHLHNSLIATPL